MKLFHFAAILSLISAPVLLAEPETITIRKSDRAAVALSPIGGGVDAPLRKALELSGAVTITPEAEAGFVISGQAGGSGLQGRMTERGGGVALSSTYSGNARAAAHRFADEIVETLTGEPGFASSKIAFVGTRTGRKEIYTCDYDGGNLQQLTRDNAISVAPSLGPGGRLLAYTGYHSGYADIYMIDLSSGSRNRIIKLPGTNSGAAISPDGRRLAATASRDGNPELYAFNINGGSPRRLTRTPGVDSSPTWSPNSSEIIFSSDTGGAPQLYRISANGGSPTRINTGYGWTTEPSWSPNGHLLAFNVRQGGTFQIAVMDMRSGQTRVVTSGASAEDPAWGANSRHFLYSQGGRLFMHDYLTGNRIVVAEGVGKITEPTWSR